MIRCNLIIISLFLSGILFSNNSMAGDIVSKDKYADFGDAIKGRSPDEPMSFKDDKLERFVINEKCQILARNTHGGVSMGFNGEKYTMPDYKRAALIYVRCDGLNMVLKSGYRHYVVFKNGKKAYMSNGVPHDEQFNTSFEGKPAFYEIKSADTETINIINFYEGNDKYYSVSIYSQGGDDKKEVLDKYASLLRKDIN